ncbi:hypothetical protein CA85_45870 [Allorhodopirellula solitaria]|uniref:Uncharacterized protein n=1 Tax=Allorhodopirellula solitaria TaxID=2527987 RepID=A0A5C5WYS9_9BACT|nr:hypothetical protein CA85_45870 [Allorhodopirellula solitaria]
MLPNTKIFQNSILQPNERLMNFKFILTIPLILLTCGAASTARAGIVLTMTPSAASYGPVRKQLRESCKLVSSLSTEASDEECLPRRC